MASIVSVDTIRGLTSGQVTLPSGHKIRGTDAGSISAPGTVVQVIQSPLIGNLAANLTYTTTANQNNKSGYVALGSSYNFSITTKLANSKLLISGGLSMTGLTSHQFFDLYVTGAVTGWLSELHGGGAYDGLITNHITTSDHYVRNSYELLYSPNLVAGATLTFAPYIGSWVGGTMYINQYPTSGNYNSTHTTGTIIREIAQ
jgi:hypothetical protein